MYQYSLWPLPFDTWSPILTPQQCDAMPLFPLVKLAWQIVTTQIFVSGSLSVQVSYTLFDKYTLTCVHKYRLGTLHSKSSVFCIFCLSWDPTSDTLWTPLPCLYLPFPNAVQLESCSMKLLQLGFICLGVFICVSSKLSCSVAHFFFPLNSILLSVCTAVYLSIPLLKHAS